MAAVKYIIFITSAIKMLIIDKNIHIRPNNTVSVKSRKVESAKKFCYNQ